MSPVLLISVILAAASADLRSPWPDAAAVKKSEGEVRELFSADIKKATTSADKVKLAQEFLAAAERTGDDEVGRFVLLSLAKIYAIDAKDKKLAMEAAQAVIERYKPEHSMKPKELLDEGDKRLTSAKKEKSAVKKLEMQVEAFEFYTLAKVEATGLVRQLCEKRLTDLMMDGGDKKNGKMNDLKLLIGDWKVSKPKNQIGTWTFSTDGTVVSDMNKGRTTGRWEITDDVVTIHWSNRCWDTFTRPLKAKDQRGDGWDGQGVIVANKINSKRQ